MQIGLKGIIYHLCQHNKILFVINLDIRLLSNITLEAEVSGSHIFPTLLEVGPPLMKNLEYFA